MKPNERFQLQQLFSHDINSAIVLCQKLFIGEKDQNQSFDSWLKTESKSITEYSCKVTWNTPRLVVICQNCEIGKNSGICIPCYLNGNHEGHDVRLEISDYGSCDCGNVSSWKSSGFCCHHYSMPADPYEQDFGKKRSEFLADVIELALSVLIRLGKKKELFDDLKEVVKFLIDVSSIGDAYRRLVSQVLADQYDFNKLLINWPSFTIEASKEIYKLFLVLISDDLFTSNFSDAFCSQYLYLLGLELNKDFKLEEPIIDDDDDDRLNSSILEISFYVFNYLTSHPELMSLYNIPVLVAKTINLYTLLFNTDKTHPIIAQSVMYNYFENIDILIKSPSFLELICSEQYRNSLNLICESLASIECVPNILLTNSLDIDDNFISNSIRFHQYLFNIIIRLSRIDCDSFVFFQQLSYFVIMNVVRDILDDTENQGVQIYKRSILDSGISCGAFLPIHYLTFQHFCSHSKNGKYDWYSMSKKIGHPSFLFDATILPIRACALCNLITMDVINPRKYSRLTSFFEDFNIDNYSQGRYAAAICALSFANDIEEMVTCILNVFGVFNVFENPCNIQISKILFSFFYFISCCVCDITVFAKTEYEVLRQKVINCLRESIQTGSSLFETLGEVDDQLSLVNILNEVAERITDGDTTSFQLYSNYNYFTPSIFSPPNILYDILTSLNLKFPIILQRIYLTPETPFPEGFQPQRALLTSAFFATAFATLSEYKQKDEAVSMPVIQLLLNIIIYISSITQIIPITENLHVIKAANFTELTQKVPKSFSVFLKTPISYNGRPASTFWDFCRSIGQVGITFINIITQKSVKFTPTEIFNIKEIIFQEYEIRKFNYISQTFIFPPIKKCSACKKKLNSFEIIPIIIYSFVMPEDHRKTNLYLFGGNLYHKKCEITIKNYYNIYNLNSVIKSFGTFIQLIESICDTITILEIRNVENPFTFLDDSLSIVHPRLFNLAIRWFKTLKNTKFETTNILVKFVIDLIKCNNPKQQYLTISNNYIQKCKTFTILRRFFLIIYYCLEVNCDVEIVNDIDEIKKFFKIQDIQEIDTELHYFPFQNLPKNFLQFSSDPYNYPILCTEDDSQELLFCVITGKCLSFNEIDEYLKEIQCSLFIVLTGPQTGSVKFLHSNISYLNHHIPSPYINIFGEEDYGLKNGQMLLLSEDRKWRLFDEFLSGQILESNLCSCKNSS